MTKKKVNIGLLIVGFLITGTIANWVLGFFLDTDWIKIVLSFVIALIVGIIIFKRGKSKKNEVVENPEQQSTTGQLASEYMKVQGYSNIVGGIIAFIVGGILVLIGIVLAWVFSNFFPLIFSGVGLLIILAGYFGFKSSKKLREGKYYQMGEGWVKPE